MAKLDEAGLRAQIKSGEYSNAYFIYGEESYLKEHYVSQIKKKLINPAFEDFNLHMYEGKECQLDDALKDAQILPMMDEYNLVIVKDYPITRSKSDIKLLEEYLEDLNESTVFIMLYDAVTLDEKTATFRNLIKLFDNSGSVVNLQKRTEGDVARLLVSGAKKRGSSLDLNNARYLISVSGNDMKVLLNELDKLSYYSQGKEITKQTIDEIATKCLQARVYDVSKAVTAGNADNAYKALATLFELREDPIIINAAISGVYVDMYRVKCAKAAGKSYDDVAAVFNYKGREFALKNASRDCAKLSQDQLRCSLDAILETDVKLKSTGLDSRLLLEELISKLLLIARGVSYA